MLQHKTQIWVGSYLIEAYECIKLPDVVWRAWANRSFYAHDSNVDAVKQCILREVYHRFLT